MSRRLRLKVRIITSPPRRMALCANDVPVTMVRHRAYVQYNLATHRIKPPKQYRFRSLCLTSYACIGLLFRYDVENLFSLAYCFEYRLSSLSVNVSLCLGKYLIKRIFVRRSFSSDFEQ